MGEALADDGTRLRARFLTGADGSRQWNYTWWDNQRNEECSYQRAGDGQWRCLPGSAGAASGYFGDANCQAVLAYHALTGCNANSAYVTVPNGETCGGNTVHLIGAPYLGASIYYRDTAGSCAPTSNPYLNSASYQMVHVGAEVAAASFVAATLD